ncbi:glycosyltransferase [Coprobacter tertius]|uniref:Glycosyltransferase n=1 Tax=Coprobacter tertius TaxID=2944915 RepID=A0ABT1MJ89_9BACT|nr:glycosyltransferase [Coprobacter tertius]MCP9612692.1 glycosyltransferase [Coprobacter tertius]
MEKLLSVIVPLFNGEKYIGKCLESLIHQNIEPEKYEILVINDGSTDNGVKIAENYSKEYSQIKVITQKNGGLSSARNTGIRNSSGRYLCFVDSDDFIVENTLKSILQIAIDNYFEILTYGIVGGQEDEFTNKKYCRNFSEIEAAQSGIRYIADHNYNNGAWYYLISKDFIIKHNLYFEEGRYCEDGMFTTKAFLLAERMSAVHADVYCYVRHAGTITTSKNMTHLLKVIDDFIYAIHYLTSLIEEHKNKMSVACYERCISRRNSYLFFLFIRMYKSNLPNARIKEIIGSLSAEGLYPFGRMLKKDYKNKKFSILWYIMNHRGLYLLLCRFNSILKK